MQENRKNYLAITLVVAVFFGLLSGVVANFVFNAYFQDVYDSVFLREIDLSSGNYRGSSLTIREARKVVVEQDDRIGSVIDSSQGSLVGIFKKKIRSDKAFDPENYYKAGGETGQGLIITSDGWIISNLKAESMSDFVVVTSDKKIYGIDKVISDRLTSFSFLHIEGRDFPVKGFAQAQDMKNGQSVLAINWGGGSRLTSLVENKMDNTIRSSDSYSGQLILADDPDSLVLFGLDGNVVGLSGNNKTYPINIFTSAIRSVLKNKTIRRASLGVNYISLSDLIAVDPKEINQNKGAMLYKTDTLPAVLSGSGAEAAGLKEGDIILSVNNMEINKDNNLTDVIQGFEPGAAIDVSFMRGGIKKDVQIKLGELK